MNLIFAGTPMFAVPTLAALHAAGHTTVAVYTQPDRPAGRGRKLAISPIKQYALAHGLPVYQSETLRDRAPELAALRPDAMIVVAYGLILPAAILAIPKFGCVNVHASLLPRWRGAAPIARAIEAGDTETGITIMQMDAGLDTGSILAQAPMPILDTDTNASLEPRLAQLGANLLVATLTDIERGVIHARAQDNAHARYAHKLKKSEAPLDWTQPALALARKIRAFQPWPVATTRWRDQSLRLWDAHAKSASASSAPPGTVIAADGDVIRVQTGDGVLAITNLQAPGGRAMSAREFLNGQPLARGEHLG